MSKASTYADADRFYAYLFRAGETEKYALSSDKTGANLPPKDEPWILIGSSGEIDLQVDYEQVRKEVAEFGYCLLADEQ